MHTKNVDRKSMMKKTRQTANAESGSETGVFTTFFNGFSNQYSTRLLIGWDCNQIKAIRMQLVAVRKRSLGACEADFPRWRS